MPQPLTFLIDDAARRFGQVRVGYAEAFVRSDDEATLFAAARPPPGRHATLGLRLIAPTVLVSTIPVEMLLLIRLRELGVSPVVEGPGRDGPDRAAGRGAGTHPRASPAAPFRHGEARHAAQVAAAVPGVQLR